MKTVLPLILLLTFGLTAVPCSIAANSGQTDAAATASRHYDDALEQLNEGATVKDVFATLDLCLEADSTFENAYFLKAYVFYKLQAFESAIGEYDKLLSINPYHEEALKNRALTRLQVYDLEGALADHNRRIVLEPMNPYIYFDRAYCKGLLNDLEGSIRDYSKAISLDPEFKEAIANRGKAKMNLATSADVSEGDITTVDEACRDLNRARIMGDRSGDKLYSTYCQEMTAEDR